MVDTSINIQFDGGKISINNVKENEIQQILLKFILVQLQTLLGKPVKGYQFNNKDLQIEEIDQKNLTIPNIQLTDYEAIYTYLDKGLFTLQQKKGNEVQQFDIHQNSMKQIAQASQKFSSPAYKHRKDCTYIAQNQLVDAFGTAIDPNPNNLHTRQRERTGVTQSWAKTVKEFEQPQQKGYTMDQIREHNQPDDLWIIVNNKVYDITKYQDYHPGGRKVIQLAGGAEGTALFNNYHHFVNITFMLSKFQIGWLQC